MVGLSERHSCQTSQCHNRLRSFGAAMATALSYLLLEGFCEGKRNLPDVTQRSKQQQGYCKSCRCHTSVRHERRIQFVRQKNTKRSADVLFKNDGVLAAVYSIQSVFLLPTEKQENIVKIINKNS